MRAESVSPVFLAGLAVFRSDFENRRRRVSELFNFDFRSAEVGLRSRRPSRQAANGYESDGCAANEIGKYLFEIRDSILRQNRFIRTMAVRLDTRS